MAASEETPPIRWARVLGVILAVFLVVEAGAQAFFFAWTGRPYGSVFLYKWSPYGLVRNNPDLTGNFTISPDGFREVRRYSRKKPPNTFRVLLMGGSVLYAGGTLVNALPGFVPSDETISQYLAKRLQADPAFAGVNVEVINTGVNFNRIMEVSGAYLSDYIQWSPDVVIVFGSANNFSQEPRAGDLAAFQTPLQAWHPWRQEFERLVNERSLPATIEVAFRQGVDASASLALLHKALQRAIVDSDLTSHIALHPPSRVRFPDRPERPLATADEEAEYFRLYTAYADAIIAAARREGQTPAFVWEYHLGDIGPMKRMTAEEKSIYPGAKRPQYEIDYEFRTERRWEQYFAGEGVATVSPLQAIISSPRTVYHDYLHYTADGNDVIAGAVYDQLHDVFLQALARGRERHEPS